jgi:L-amino acid N-acyltransferase YncA
MMRILPYHSDHAPAILNIYRPFIEKTSVSFEVEVPSESAFQERLNNITSKFPLMVLMEDETLLGYAYASTHRERPAYRWAVETSIYMAPEAQGKGLGYLLYKNLLQELIARGFTHAFGIITVPNNASVYLHSKCGFSHLAVHEKAGWKFGKWHDVLWMRKDLFSQPNQPTEPVFESWNGEIML